MGALQWCEKMMGERLYTTDDFGYPTQPDSRRRVRNISVRTSKRLLLTGIYLLMSIIGIFLWLARLGQRRGRPQGIAPTLVPGRAKAGPYTVVRRILVIRLDLIGDLVLSMMLVRALKR